MATFPQIHTYTDHIPLNLFLDPGTKVGHDSYPIGMDIPDDMGCNVIHWATLRKGPDKEFEIMIHAFMSQISSIK
jgi:hypothetical protein